MDFKLKIVFVTVWRAFDLKQFLPCSLSSLKDGVHYVFSHHLACRIFNIFSKFLWPSSVLLFNLIFVLYFQNRRGYSFIPPNKATKDLEIRSVNVNTANTSPVTSITVQPAKEEGNESNARNYQVISIILYFLNH